MKKYTPTARTEAGNAELFAHLVGDRVRFDHRLGRWVFFDGHRWRYDNQHQVFGLATAAARLRHKAALGIENTHEREEESKWALSSESRYRIESSLKLAQAEPTLADSGDNWDADQWLLGVENGVVDLRTGTLRDGRPEDRITKHTNIVFDFHAQCPRWEQFLREVFIEDELIDFIHRAVGYSLTGLNTEQCLFMLIGTGANGKSVMLGILRSLFGDYATNTAFSTFEKHARSSITNDLAALVGRRLVTASETSAGTRLNEDRLKAWTGGDVVTARFLYREPFDFIPVGKLWLAMNHKPLVADLSEGFWRRIHLVPFRAHFPVDKRDKDLHMKLVQEAPGILAWAVRGCLLWQQKGLFPPEVVSAATTEYRQESDPLARFTDEKCELETGAFAPAAELFEAYEVWHQSQVDPPEQQLSSREFGEMLKKRFSRKRHSQGNRYEGIRLREISTGGGVV